MPKKKTPQRVSPATRPAFRKLEAIKESLVFRQELHNLVRELKAQGIKLDENKVFVA